LTDVTPHPLKATASASVRRVRSRAESGFTVIEVLVATIVLTLGIVSLIGAFDSSRTVGTTAEAHQSAVALAQHELERVSAQKWTKLSLTTTTKPTQTATTDKHDPTYYEQPSATKCKGQGPTESNCYRWNWSSSESTYFEPLVIESEAEAAEASDSTPNPSTVTTTVTAGGATTRFTFKVYRFITWVNDKEKCPVSTCENGSDDKRVLIAVTGSKLDTPVTLLSVVNNSVLESKNPLKGLSCKEGSETVACVNQKS
jgi:Tfp pilus assembly protein PilV